MKVLVTGCAGFIGSAVARLLLEEGHDVVGVDDMNDYYDVRLKEHRLGTLTASDAFAFHRHDVADRQAITRLFDDQDFDRVYHLAARAGVRQSTVEPWIYTRANVDGTLSLLEACRHHDVDRLLMASTSSLYGIDNETPFTETADTSRPLSPYAASKKGAEALCASYSHLYGMHTVIPRYFTVYGPAGRPDMSVFRFIRWIATEEPVLLFGDGEQSRDFTYVEDIARGTLTVAEHGRGFDIVNLGGDKPHTINHLIAVIEEAFGNEARVERHDAHEADVHATWANISKARSMGWAPQVSLEDGLRRTVEWYNKHTKFVNDLMLDAAPIVSAN